MSVFGELTCPACKGKRYNRYDPQKHPDGVVKCGHCRSLGNRAGCKSTHKIRKSHEGYSLVWVGKEDPFFKMACPGPSGNFGTIRGHRLIMARHLGRCLGSGELVHHKNGIKDDNRLENLELVTSNGEHIKNHSRGYEDGYHRGLIDGRLKQIQELKGEIRRLQNG